MTDSDFLFLTKETDNIIMVDIYSIDIIDEMFIGSETLTRAMNILDYNYVDTKKSTIILGEEYDDMCYGEHCTRIRRLYVLRMWEGKRE